MFRLWIDSELQKLKSWPGCIIGNNCELWPFDPDSINYLPTDECCLNWIVRHLGLWEVLAEHSTPSSAASNYFCLIALSTTDTGQTCTFIVFTHHHPTLIGCALESVIELKWLYFSAIYFIYLRPDLSSSWTSVLLLLSIVSGHSNYLYRRIFGCPTKREVICKTRILLLLGYNCRYVPRRSNEITNFMCPCHRQLISDLFAITRNLWKSFNALIFL